VLSVNEQKSGVELVVLRPVHKIRGLVLDPDGRPLPGARIVASAELQGAASKRDSFTARQTDTDADGRFAVDGLVAGLHTVWVSHPRYAELQRAHVNADTRDLSLELSVSVDLGGFVTTPAGKPVERYTLTVLPAGLPGEDPRTRMRRENSFDNPQHEIRDPGGRFVVHAAPGRYDLLVKTESGATGAVRGIELVGNHTAPPVQILVDSARATAKGP
jgi:hypothetical protein